MVPEISSDLSRVIPGLGRKGRVPHAVRSTAAGAIVECGLGEEVCSPAAEECLQSAERVKLPCAPLQSLRSTTTMWRACCGACAMSPKP